MTGNPLANLNEHLFNQLDRLSGADLSLERIEQECQRTEAIVSLAEQIVRGVDVQLKAATLINLHGDRFAKMVPLLESKSA